MTVVTATKTQAASRWPLRPCNTTQRAAETQVSGGPTPRALFPDPQSTVPPEGPWPCPLLPLHAKDT